RQASPTSPKRLARDRNQGCRSLELRRQTRLQNRNPEVDRQPSLIDPKTFQTRQATAATRVHGQGRDILTSEVDMLQTLSVTRTTESRLSDALRENAEFGCVFSDHMFVAEYNDGKWNDSRIVPYGPMSLPPSVSAFHYGQSIFEGFKAHRTADGGIALFRPRDNYARLNRSAARLAMPEVPEDLFLDGVKELVRLDREWTPHREGGALYVRPIYFGLDEALIVRPARRYRLVIFTCPVGPYFSQPIRLLAEEHFVRACPGGTGDIKAAGNYAGGLLAARLAQEQGFHNVLWLDSAERHLIEEVGVMNVCFVSSGVAITPPLGGTILPGITRDSVIP